MGRALSVDAEAAAETLLSADAAGVDLGAITASLERKGVRSFCNSYDSSYSASKARRKIATASRDPGLGIGGGRDAG